jgi:hypothetical protein
VELVDCRVLVNQGKEVDFMVDENVILKFRDRVCVSDVLELKNMILEEIHRSSLSIHPMTTNIYQDLKNYFGGHV